jgi:phosphoenolpyruvate carboxylase
MKKPTVRIYTGDGEFIDREMNNDEFAQYKIDQAVAATVKAEAEAKEAARQAILDRLGLTADELQTILG